MKKKVFLLLTFIVLALGILFSGSKPKVEAAESCENHTIYYLLLDATKAITFKSAYTNYYNGASSEDVFAYSAKTSDEKDGMWVYTTTKLFNAVPKTRAKNIEETNVKLGKTTGSGVEMTYAEFLEWYKKLEDNVEYDAGNNVTYIRAIPWVRGDTSEKEEEDVRLSSYNMKEVTETTFVNHIPTNYGSPRISIFTQSTSSITLQVNRTWKWVDRVQGYDNTTDGSVVIFSPAVYKITYEVCEEVEDPVDTETVYVNFCELGDRVCSNLADPIKLGEFEIGDDKPTYNCPDPLSNYPASSRYTINVSDPENYKFDSDDGNDGGKIKEEKNNDIYCYYTKDETVAPTEHTLTVKYGSSEDCSNTIAKTVTKPGLVSGDSVSVDAPSIITVSDAKMTYSQVGNVSPRSFSNYSVGNQKLTVTMPDSDVTICLVYTPKTGLSKGWLYLVWAIGLGSLGYSGWYFYRYYKNKKQEI